MKGKHNDLLVKHLQRLNDLDGITNAEVARQIKIDRSQLNRFKKGQKVPKRIIDAIEEAYPQLKNETDRPPPNVEEPTEITKKYTSALEDIVRLQKENKELALKNKDMAMKYEILQKEIDKLTQ